MLAFCKWTRHRGPCASAIISCLGTQLGWSAHTFFWQGYVSNHRRTPAGQVIKDGVTWRTTQQDVAANERLLRAFLLCQSHLSYGLFIADVFLQLNTRLGGNLFGARLSSAEQLQCATREAGKVKKLVSHLMYMKSRASASRDPARRSHLCRAKSPRCLHEGTRAGAGPAMCS